MRVLDVRMKIGQSDLRCVCIKVALSVTPHSVEKRGLASRARSEAPSALA